MLVWVTTHFAILKKHNCYTDSRLMFKVNYNILRNIRSSWFSINICILHTWIKYKIFITLVLILCHSLYSFIYFIRGDESHGQKNSVILQLHFDNPIKSTKKKVQKIQVCTGAGPVKAQHPAIGTVIILR